MSGNLSAFAYLLASVCFIMALRGLSSPPKILTDARITAKNPNTLARLNSVGLAAIKAPTMITEEIALVTLISGECSAGVTLQTT